MNKRKDFKESKRNIDNDLARYRRSIQKEKSHKISTD